MVSLAESSTTHDACADLPNAVNVPNEFGFRFAETGTCLTTIVTDESVTALAVALILTLMPAALLALRALHARARHLPDDERRRRVRHGARGLFDLDVEAGRAARAVGVRKAVGVDADGLA